MPPDNKNTTRPRGLRAIARAGILAVVAFTCCIPDAACAAGIQDLMPAPCRERSPACKLL